MGLPCRDPFLHERPEAGDRLSAELRHARLTHPDDLADLGQREFFLVGERENLALPLGDLLQGLGQFLPEFAPLELAVRTVLVDGDVKQAG